MTWCSSLGAGPIGLSALEFVQLTGANVTVMDREKSRLDLCANQYDVANVIQVQGPATDRISSLTNGDKFAVVIDATGNASSMSQAVNYVAHSGVLIYLGVTTGNISFPHPGMHRSEITIRASRNALPDDFTRCIELIESGEIDTTKWITDRIAFGDVVTEFEQITRPETETLKAVIDFMRTPILLVGICLIFFYSVHLRERTTQYHFDLYR